MPVTAPTHHRLTPAPHRPFAPNVPRDQFLDQLARRSFRFFWEMAHPDTGLVADRALADGSACYRVASVAATGFGLAALCVADARGYHPRSDLLHRARTTLRALHAAPAPGGFFYHFLHLDSAARAWQSEASTIDTALFLAGALTARSYFDDPELSRLVELVYDRVDWPWMLDPDSHIRHGWTPERGFLPYSWDRYSEHLILQLLALGSDTHAVDQRIWRAWERGPVVHVGPYRFLSEPPLFVHQFSHAFIDFRRLGVGSDGIDYWDNSVQATHAHRDMFASLKDRFKFYGGNLWGLTSSDSARGYTAWGGPSPTANIDGTIVPCAAAGSIPFAPEACLDALHFMYEEYRPLIWRAYGFVDAFNPHTGWAAKHVIGIDVGITLLMLENHRTSLIWNAFMDNPQVCEAITKAGYQQCPIPQKL